MLNDVIVLAWPERDRENARVVVWWIQSNIVKEVVKASRKAVFVVFVCRRRGEGEWLVNETLYNNPSSFSISQAAPPVAKTGTIDSNRGWV